MDQNTCPKCSRFYSSTINCDCSDEKDINRGYSTYDWEQIKKIKEILEKSCEPMNPIDELQNLKQNGRNFQTEDIQIQMRPIACPGDIEPANFQLEEIQKQIIPIACPGEVDPANFHLEDVQRQMRPISCLGEINMTNFQQENIWRQRRPMFTCSDDIGAANSHLEDIQMQSRTIACSEEIGAVYFHREDIQRQMELIASPGDIDLDNFQLESFQRQSGQIACSGEVNPTINTAFVKQNENLLKNVGSVSPNEYEIPKTRYLDILKPEGHRFVPSTYKRMGYIDSCIDYLPTHRNNFSTSIDASKSSEVSCEFSASKKHTYRDGFNEIASKCHLQEQVLSYEQKESYCSSCDKRLSNKQSLKAHIRSYTVYIPYVCEICKQEMTLLCGLENHLRSHSEAFKLKCDICNQQFRLLRTLVKHRRTH